MTDVDAAHAQHPPVPDLPRTAVVTGAGRGIGRGLALGLAAHGYAVALLGRTQAHLNAVAAEIAEQSPGVRCLVVAVDLTDAPAVGGAARYLEAELGDLGGNRVQVR